MQSLYQEITVVWQQAGLTHEDVECKGCCLASAGLVVTNKPDDIPRLLDIVIILLEICKDLSRTLVQWQSSFLFWTLGFESFAYPLCFRSTFDL